MARKREPHIDRCTHPGCTEDTSLVAGQCPTHRAATQSPTGERPRVQERRLEQWQHQWADIRRLANELHDAGEIVLAAGEHIATDAFPTSLRGQEGRGAGDHADPILAKVERDGGGIDDEQDPTNNTADTWAAPPDLVAEWVRELMLVTSEVRGHMRRLGRLKDMIVNRRDPRISDIGGNCAACYRPVAGGPADPLRALYCSACYQAWLRWAAGKEDPAHHLYEQWRRQQLDQGQGAA